MPGGLDSTDRKLLVGAGALAMVMAAATVAIAPAGKGIESRVPSSYSSDPAGARAAYLLLQELHYRVRRWEQPPSALAELGRGAVLILAEPNQAPTSSERASLLKFVRSGGRILFCGDGLATFFPGAPVSNVSAGEEWAEFSSDLPTRFSRGARKITMEPKSTWTKLSSEQFALYGNESAPVAVIWKIGEGELLWWGAPTPLSNAGIKRTDNLTLFLNAVSGETGEAPLNVYWDEYFHGIRGSLWSYIGATPVKWALVQFLFLTAAVLFTYSRRWGPVRKPRSVSRLSPLEFVDTLGGLYERAGATAVPIGVAYRHLRLSLTRRLALPAGISDAELARAAAERLGWNSAMVTATLESAAMAQAHNVRTREALKLVQEIGDYTTRLESRRVTQENK